MIVKRCPRCGRMDFAFTRVPIAQNSNGTYRFEISNINNCPNCGALFSDTKKKYNSFISFIGVSEELQPAVELLLDGYNDSAIREATTILENIIKSRSGLDISGRDLVSKAFSSKEKGPLIKVNKLETQSEKNEQEGIQLMLMGYFQLIRNISHHSSIGHSSFQTFEILCITDFLLKIINGKSFTERAYWIKVKNEGPMIMPKRVDRIKLKAFGILNSMYSAAIRLNK